MSWFQSTNLASFAKTALKEAQKTIDKALEINEEGNSTSTTAAAGVAAVTEAASDFFSSWGVQVGAKKTNKKDDEEERSLKPSESPLTSSSIPPIPPAVTEPKSGDAAPQSHTSSKTRNSSNHRRSASLELTESPQITFPLSAASMHTSLTSDIPVTLMAPSSTCPNAKNLIEDVSNSSTNPLIPKFHDDSGSRSQSQSQHSRSLSDTVFHSQNFLDDFDGTLQVLDFDDVTTTTTQPILPLPLVQSSCPTSFPQDDVLCSSKGRDFEDDTDNIEDNQDKEGIYIDSKYSKVESRTEYINSNLDLLSTVDLGVVPFLSSPETPADCFATNSNEEESFNDALPTELAAELPEYNNDDDVVHRDIQDSSSFCDSNTWSWTEPEPDTQQQQVSSSKEQIVEISTKDSEFSESRTSRTGLQESSSLDPESEANKEELKNRTEDSGVGMETSVETTTESQTQGTNSEADVEGCESFSNKSLPPLPPSPCSRSPPPPSQSLEKEETVEDGQEEHWALHDELHSSCSPAPEFPEIPSNDSPPSSSPVLILNELEGGSERESGFSPPSPSMLDQRLSDSAPKSPDTLDVLEGEAMPFGSQHQQEQHIELPESSRSSSIVVVSGRNSTPSGSAASTGSSASEGGHHDIEDHSHNNPPSSSSSNGYERVDMPSINSPHNPDPSVPEVIKGKERSKKFVKGKKGQSSSASSSSDIEVIPLGSDFSPGSSSGAVVERSKAQEERGQQTSPIPPPLSKEMESQTDEELLVEVGKSQPAPSAPSNDGASSDLIREKDEMIAELRVEGEKLSKRQFEVGQVVKKLRGKEKEMELTIKLLKGELAGKSLENERLMKSYVSKESLQQTQNDTIQKLTLDKRELELKIQQITSELEDANENSASMKASLEDASVEMLELKNAISSCQRDTGEMDSLTREKCELISRNDFLQKEVDHLRVTVNSTQSKGSNRETELQSQITILTRKVHTLENELSDISSEVADATMPLSLEIEKLQAELKNASSQHEKRESALQSLIKDLELKVASNVDKEKGQKELQLSLQTNVSSLEERLEDLEKENRKLTQELFSRDEKERLGLEERSWKVTKLESEVTRLHAEIERLCDENEALGCELKSEKSVVELERKKSQSLMDQLTSSNRNGLTNQLNQNHNFVGGSTTQRNSVSMSNNNGTGGVLKSGENSPSSHSITSETSYLDEVFDPNGPNGGGINRSMTPKSFFESFSSLGLIENLQSQLRQRETEVSQFQDQVSKNERIRRTLNEEIAKLTMQNQEFQIEMERLIHFQNRLEEVEKNNNALLQMYGEKVEEADELRMDLQDVKDMYKAQIEQLLKK